MSAEEVNKLLNDIHAMKGKQENIDTRIMTMRQYDQSQRLFKGRAADELITVFCFRENEALWREVASLRQKHTQQQKVVRKVTNTLKILTTFHHSVFLL